MQISLVHNINKGEDKMSYKLICIDMDGTLLNDKKTVNKENIEAIKKAHDKGVKIAICTGRLFASAKYFGALIGVQAPIIASNGAYIREKDRDEVIYESILGVDKCRKIQSVVGTYDFDYYYNRCDCVISAKDYPEEYGYVAANKVIPDEYKVKLVKSHDINKTIEEDGDKILKCICMSRDREKLISAKQKLELFNEFEIVSSGYDNIEIMNKEVSKGHACGVLASFYNLSREEVMCIGDNGNDISMIEYAGMGVAMGNASDEVKKIANFITDTNNNSGVAKAIEKFVLY